MSEFDLDLLMNQGRYAEAMRITDQVLKFARREFGENHPSYVACLYSKAELCLKSGNYTESELLFQQALNFYRTTDGPTSTPVTNCMGKLAELYRTIGNFPAAEQLGKEVLEIQRNTNGENSIGFAVALFDLGTLYKVMGNFAAAEPLYHRAATIHASILGEDDPDYAILLNNRGTLCRAVGNYAAAEKYHLQALEIRRKKLGGNHLDYSQSLNNLGVLYIDMGKFDEAPKLLTEALEIRRRNLGENHPLVAHSLNNIADCYLATGDPTQVERCHLRALEIGRKSLGKKHPDVAQSLDNLAVFHLLRGKYAKAESFVRQALELRREAFGKKHPLFADSLETLTWLCAATDRLREGLELMMEAALIDEHMIGQVFSISSESQRMAYLELIQRRYYQLLTLVLDNLNAGLQKATFVDRFYKLLTFGSGNPSHSSLSIPSIFDLVLRRKAVGAEALAAQRDAVLGGKYPTLKPKLQELSTLRTQIAQKTLAGPGTEGSSAHEQLLDEWNIRKDRLEALLAQQIPEMNLEQKIRAADRQEVAKFIPEGAALVEFVRFKVRDFKAVITHDKPILKQARYLAFVLPAGEPDNLQMIDLGEAEPIDRMIATFRSAITAKDESDGKRDLGALPSEPVGEPDNSDGAALRVALFDPLLPAIGNHKRLLLAPDGDLTRLPFEALPTDDGRRLIDDYQISYLGVGRDVLRFGAASSGQPTAALVAADPDFDLSGGQAHAQATSETVGALQRGRVSREIQTGALEQLGRLPGTRVEGERIASMLGVKPLLGEKALEARIKACRSPRILHLATHGFFLADRRRDPNQELRGLGMLGGQAGDGFGQMPISMLERMSGPGMENPLLRSGVLLAGFKTWLKGGSLPAEAEDGLLTAEDVSGLDLLATELVVLSACETGLGEVRTGEGVFGLRRAFVLAGAKTLVMSLWKVPDLATAILMERFYDNLLNRRDSSNRPFSRSESLREAQFHTRDVTVGQIRDRWLNAEMIERLSAGNPRVRRELQELAQEPDDYHSFAHPLYWGAFICQGDPGPLPAQI